METDPTVMEWVLDDHEGVEWEPDGDHGRTWGTDEYLSTRAGGEEYGGPYEASALFSEQVFPTEEKHMLHDFTVHAINYTEAPNEYGTTVTIGG